MDAKLLEAGKRHQVSMLAIIDKWALEEANLKSLLSLPHTKFF